MQLTRFTDYSLRVLIYLAINEGRIVSITEVSEAYGISRNHLMKVVHNLAKRGHIASLQGRGGGLTLGADPNEINLGSVVRHTEPSFRLAECFESDSDACPISPACHLRTAFRRATEAFLDVLDGYSLADLTRNRHRLATLLS